MTSPQLATMTAPGERTFSTTLSAQTTSHLHSKLHAPQTRMRSSTSTTTISNIPGRSWPRCSISSSNSRLPTCLLMVLVCKAISFPEAFPGTSLPYYNNLPPLVLRYVFSCSFTTTMLTRPQKYRSPSRNLTSAWLCRRTIKSFNNKKQTIRTSSARVHKSRAVLELQSGTSRISTPGYLRRLVVKAQHAHGTRTWRRSQRMTVLSRVFEQRSHLYG